jgi:general secretion pathway protein K
MTIPQGTVGLSGQAGKGGIVPGRSFSGSMAGSRAGFALMVVIIILLIVSFLASQLILQVQTEQKIAFNVKKKAYSRLLSEAGMQIALFRTLEPKTVVDEEDQLFQFIEGKTYDTFFNQGKISYSTVNESGKIDLNRAPRQLLELFCEYHGLEMEETGTLIDSLMDWRDSDDLLRLNGAEANYYEELEDPYLPRNGEIEDPAEFLLIQGAELLAEKFVVEDVFTVNNSDGKINFNSLTPDMLAFLTEGDLDRQEVYHENQELVGTLNQTHARQVLGDERYERLRPYLTFSSPNKFYSITSIGRAGVKPDEETAEDQDQEQPGMKLQVLFRVKGSTDYELLSWRENHA